jgi:CheY-like chemotaxis protein
MEAKLTQLHRLDAVGQLTGGVAHDFNNLLTVILGNADLMAEFLPEGDPLREMVDMSRMAAERGAELTRRLLAFARRQPLAPRPTDVNRLVAELAPLARRTLGENVELEVVHAAGLWPAEIDPGEMENAILNLCLNARDAMRSKGGGKLTVETANTVLDDAYSHVHDEVRPGRYVMVAVSDTGEGMSADVVARVFEPFFTTKGVGKGSGLGLSQVFGFARQSNGHVKVYSEPGVGTTVRLYVPRATRAVDDRPPQKDDSTPHGSETVLLVEDDPLVRAHAATLLKALGYTPLEAEDGPAALALVAAGTPFDILFTDVVMPGGMSGRDLADAIARHRPNVAILFTSGYTENAIVHHGRLDRGVLLLAKPYRRQQLAEKLREALELRGHRAVPHQTN